MLVLETMYIATVAEITKKEKFAVLKKPRKQIMYKLVPYFYSKIVDSSFQWMSTSHSKTTIIFFMAAVRFVFLTNTISHSALATTQLR